MRRTALIVLVGVLLAPAPAAAAVSGAHVHGVLVPAFLGLGGVFHSIGHALLGAFSWTIGLASKFILTTVAALVRMLIPRSWVHQGLSIMQWIVAVPNYAGHITSPTGATSYGFAGINALRDLFMWLGVAAAPLSLVYATSRAMIGEGDPVAVPLVRMLAVAVVVIAYPYWWAQATALADQVTHAILAVPDVTRGLYKLMDYAVAGVALGGWQLVDLALMGALGLELLGLIFIKVVLVLLGALLYAVGPVMIGLVPTRAGGAIARAWVSSVITILALGVGWAVLFAVGALLIGDAGTAGPLVAGTSSLGAIAGGLLLAVCGLASLWLCLKLAKEAAALLRLQLSGLLISAGTHHSPHTRPTTQTRAATSGSSLRSYGTRLASASRAATGEMALAGPAGAALAGGARGAGHLGRHGLLGSAALAGRAGAGRLAGPATGALGQTRAGVLASRMARAGTASWTNPRPPTPNRPTHAPTSDGATPPPNGASGAAPGSTSTNGNGSGNGNGTPRPPASRNGARPQTGNGSPDNSAGPAPDRRPGSRAAGSSRPAAPPPPPTSANPTSTRPSASPGERPGQRPPGTPSPPPADAHTPRPDTVRRSPSPPPPPRRVTGPRQPTDGLAKRPTKPLPTPGKKRRSPKRGRR